MTDPNLFGWEAKLPPADGIPDEVRDLFEQFAVELKDRGFSSYSADAILHRIRWHYHVDRGMREFKCNNNWTSTLARWLMDKRADMRGFFELRALAEERQHR